MCCNRVGGPGVRPDLLDLSNSEINKVSRQFSLPHKKLKSRLPQLSWILVQSSTCSRYEQLLKSDCVRTETHQPNEDNIVKFAIHDLGFTHFFVSRETTSTPRTVSSHPQDGLRIPKTRVQELRKRLRRVYPDLAEKPFTSTRLC